VNPSPDPDPEGQTRRAAPPTEGYLTATGLSLATGHGPVFSDVSFSFDKGSLAVIAGPSGSGRSALLLAIGGRMRGLTGTLRVAGFDGTSQTREIRTATSIARIAHLVDLEGQLTVADSLTERALIDDLPGPRSAAVFEHAETILDRSFDRTLLVDDLSALDRTLLAVALATLRPAHVLLLDDADQQLSLADEKRLMAALQRVTDTGTTVVATVLGTEAVPPDAAVLALPFHS
jgi:ABC-type multidrug transport system ATPase subunit